MAVKYRGVGIVRWLAKDGEPGKDGKDYEWVFKRTELNIKPSRPRSEPFTDNFVDTANGWTDDPTGVSEYYKFEWASKRVRIAGEWGSFSEPALWAKWSDDGKDGDPGLPGDDGIIRFASTVFRRSDIRLTSNDKPSGGTYLNPEPNRDLNGNIIWHDGIPEGEEMLWASTRIFSSNPAEQSTWSTPTLMSDSPDFEIIYSSSISQPEPPVNTHPYPISTEWSSVASIDTIWMATSRKSRGVWSNWYVVKIKGETGEKGELGAEGPMGDGIESVIISYALHTNGTQHPTAESSWEETIPNPLTKEMYLWTRTVTSYRVKENTTAYTVTYIPKDGEKGDPGEVGSTAIAYTTGEWDFKKVYTRTEKAYPIVTYLKENNKPIHYYKDNIGTIKFDKFVPSLIPGVYNYHLNDIVWFSEFGVSGIFRSKRNNNNYSPNQIAGWANVTHLFTPNNSNEWVKVKDYEMVITEALIANFGKIGGAVFTGSKMMSEKGIDNNGNVSYDYKDYPDNFTPNIEFDFMEGMLKFGKNIRFGHSEGFSVMEFYDNDGKLLYDLGPTGISKIRTTDNSFTEVSLIPLNQTTFKNALESPNAQSIYKNSASTLPTKYYRFTSGKNATGALTDPLNNGKLFKSASTSSGIIPNGVYIDQSAGLLFLLDTEDGRNLIGLPGQSPYNESIVATNPLYNKTLTLYFDGKKDSEVIAYWNGYLIQ